jgi:hypothetical protein
MNLKSCQLCDDWGWFIDIETNNYGENILLQPCSRPRIKKFNSRVNKLPIIEEDEYEYYQKNYKDPEEILYKHVDQNYINLKQTTENTKNVNTVFNVGSTTLITAILTYIVFIVL